MSVDGGPPFFGYTPMMKREGGQIEGSHYMLVREADKYTDAACKFVERRGYLENYTKYHTSTGRLQLFTSDYGLYWFDYQS